MIIRLLTVFLLLFYKVEHGFCDAVFSLGPEKEKQAKKKITGNYHKEISFTLFMIVC